ncbi:MAG: hypothetical protein CL862_03525 [Cyanobium sp. NAT70]|nr:hypothetical protein [Cyanobium sp. NAT70]
MSLLICDQNHRLFCLSSFRSSFHQAMLNVSEVSPPTSSTLFACNMSDNEIFERYRDEIFDDCGDDYERMQHRENDQPGTYVAQYIGRHSLEELKNWGHQPVENEFLLGTFKHDVLQGLKGNDILQGGIGNDFLFGGWGQDILIGDAGVDVLVGGDQQDLFYFEDNLKKNHSPDRILDFGRWSDNHNNTEAIVFQHSFDDMGLHLVTDGDTIQVVNRRGDSKLIIETNGGGLFFASDNVIWRGDGIGFGQVNLIENHSVNDPNHHIDHMVESFLGQ